MLVACAGGPTTICLGVLACACTHAPSLTCARHITPPTHVPSHAFPVQGRSYEAWRGLGNILLCVTGAEALYADMGHFNARSIRVRRKGVLDRYWEYHGQVRGSGRIHGCCRAQLEELRAATPSRLAATLDGLGSKFG